MHESDVWNLLIQYAKTVLNGLEFRTNTSRYHSNDSTVP